jgi:hypothetical protein
MKLFFIKRTDTGQYLEWQRIVPRWTTRENATIHRSHAFAADTADTISSNDNIPVKVETYDLDAGQEALQILATLENIQHLGDYVYDIREREGLGWDGPKVAAWGGASARAEQLVRPLIAKTMLAEADDETLLDS